MNSISDSLVDVFDAIKDLLRNLYEDFKESNRYFKIKITLMISYVFICLATIMVFVPEGELNEIGARVYIDRTEIVGGRYVKVVNESPDNWRKLRVRINDRYQVEHGRLRPGRKKAFYLRRFKDKDGNRPAEDLEILRLRIECDQGAFERDFRRSN